MENIEALKNAVRTLPQTLVYNDFHWTNLALERHGNGALAYDYDLVGIGTRYSDYRNVTSVLTGDGREAFQSAYGEISQREAVLDAPLATLYALSIAVQRTSLPAWSAPLLAEVTNGALKTKLRLAIRNLTSG